jgi:teichuronic acid biosynthesis glycosyltransferase TuaC
VGFHERFTPQPLRERDDRVRLLAIGSLLPVKRVGLILEALARLDSRYTLEVAGKGPLEAALTAQARALGLAERVRFLGEIDGPSLLEALRRTDLVVHASAHEGGSIALLEALATARPVVSTAVGAAPELLAEGAGVLAEANARGFADAIERATSALDTRHRPAVERASKRVRERWVVEAVATTLLELYEELTSRGEVRRGAAPG